MQADRPYREPHFPGMVLSAEACIRTESSLSTNERSSPCIVTESPNTPTQVFRIVKTPRGIQIFDHGGHGERGARGSKSMAGEGNDGAERM